MNRRITDEQLAELRLALERGDITNATAFAQDFAGRHGLNPNTVRSTISHLRSELGLLRHRPRPQGERSAVSADASGYTLADAERSLTASAVLGWLLADADVSDLAGLGAAVLLRCEDDPHFRDAIAARRDEIADVYRDLKQTRKSAARLREEERREFFRAIMRDLKR